MRAWNATMHTRIQTHLFKPSPALFLQQERILEHFSEASLKPLLEDLLYHAKDGAHQQVGHNGYPWWGLSLSTLAKSCQELCLHPFGNFVMQIFMEPWAEMPVDFWNSEKWWELLTRSNSLLLWPQEGMSHEEWKFRKGSLRKSSYFRNLDVGEISRRFTETGLGKRCELNVDQEHAPATYRKALIEIIAQYLGAVVLQMWKFHEIEARNPHLGSWNVNRKTKGLVNIARNVGFLHC